MSSLNRGFVSAFARRDQTKPGVAREKISAPRTASPTDELGSLTLDPSIADSAEVWVDESTNQIARTDDAQADPPQPHLESPIDDETNPYDRALESLHHMHTTYATAFPVTPEPTEQEREAPETPTHIEPAAPQTEPQPAPASSISQTPCFSKHPGVGVAPEPAPLHSVDNVNEPRPLAPVAKNRIIEPEHGGYRLYPRDRAVEAPPVEQPWLAPPPADDEFTQLRVDESQARSSAPHIDGLGSHHSIAPFDAAWEVDVFDIPPCVADLFFEGMLFQQITDRMSEAVSTGLKSLLVTSSRPREGRTSTAIGIAMAAGAAGIRVALVDADTETPTLADDLRLDLQYGWVDTIRGGLPIKEVAVNAIEDGVTLIPLMPPYGRTGATPDELERLIELLTSKFELIVLDGPSGDSASLGPLVTAVDTAIIVRDVRRTNTRDINKFSYRLRESSVSGIGVVENFV